MSGCSYVFVFVFVFFSDMRVLILRFWFAGMGCQGFKVTPVSWLPCLNTLTGGILNFQLGTSWICSVVLKTVKTKLTGSLSRAVPTCLMFPHIPVRHMILWKWSVKIWWETVTYGDVLVATSVSVLSSFPGISSLISWLKKNSAFYLMLLSISMLSKNTILILPPSSVL